MSRGSRRSGRWFGCQPEEKYGSLDHTKESRFKEFQKRGAEATKSIKARQQKSLSSSRRKPSMPKFNLPDEPED